MALIKARTLAEYREGDEEVSGRATRSARRRYRKARREAKDRDKAAELRQKARALERGGKRRRKKRKGGGRAEERGPAPPAGPGRFPGGLPRGFPGRGQGQRWSNQDEAPAELEPVEPEDELDPAEVFPEEDEELGRAGQSWGPLSKMGQNLRIQAARGYRAAVILLRPGLYLVAEVPEAATAPSLGFVPLLAPLILRSASRAMRKQDGQETAETPGTALVRRRSEKGEAEAAATVGWADPTDVAAVLGCEVCDHKKR